MTVKEKVYVLALDSGASILNATISVSRNVHYRTEGISVGIRGYRTCSNALPGSRDTYSLAPAFPGPAFIDGLPIPRATPAATLAALAIACGDQDALSHKDILWRPNASATAE